MKTNKLLLVAALASVGVLASCGGNPVKDEAKDIELGVGYVTSWNGKQMDTTVVSAVFDKATGKVLSAQADVTQTKFEVATAEDGTKSVNKTAGEKSKQELGTDYHMKDYGNAIAEVYEQINTWTAYTVGKTVAEVKATEKVTEEGEHHVGSPVNMAGCTITVTAFENALANAYAHKVDAGKAKAVKAGVGMIDGGVSSKGEASLLISGAAVVDGKVAASYTDSITWTTAVAESGDAVELVANKYSDNAEQGQAIKSKRDLGDLYGMAGASPISKEYKAQMESLDAFFTGKTVAEVAAFTCEDKDETVAGVTINKLGVVNAAKEAVAYSQKDVITDKPVAK